MKWEPADLDAVAASLEEDGSPLDVDALVARTARYALERQADVPGLAPGAHFQIGQRVWYQGQMALVVDVRSRGNARQGAFEVVEVQMPDGAVTRAVAGISRAPVVVESPAVTENETACAVDAFGLQIREALSHHPRIAPRLRALQAPLQVPRTPRSRPVAARALGLPYMRRIDRAVASLSEIEVALARRQFEAVRTLWQQHTTFALHTREAPSAVETWHRFIRPALELLGWQATAMPDGGFHLSPDRTRTAVPDGLDGPGARSRAQAAVVPVGWGVTLGFGSQGGLGASPPCQVLGTLAAADVRWGILTNGRRWRLYSAAYNDPDIGSAASEYIEFDLGPIFDASGDAPPHPSRAEAFIRWWALFRPHACAPGTSGRPLWAELHSEASTYARRVVRRLRESLLEFVLPEAAGGFLAYRYHERGVRAESAQELREITRASLGLVYRLLFVLFAEQRELLPMGNADYRGHSLTALSRRSISGEDEARPLSRLTHITPYYEALLALFRNLEHGAPNLDLVSCCGGLFSPVDADYDFLERHRLSDRVVARILTALGRIDGELVDYGALTWRHLSAVAEGVLESTLWVVEASVGQVALVNTKGQAQALSSSPLPDYIALSAMERALRQTLAIRGEQYRAAMNRVVALRHRVAAGTGQIDERDSLAAAESEARDALLGVKVLDPAMGAGTFLVSALDTLVDGIMEQVASYHRSHPWVSWESDPVVRALRKARDVLTAELEERGVAQAPELFGDEVILAWLLSGSALYGVDLDATAVALSRASVSMRGFAPGAPPPALGEHLIEGNSLLGVRLSDLVAADPVATAGGKSPEGVDQAFPSPASIATLWRAAGVDFAGQNPVAGQDPEGAVMRTAAALRAEHGLLHWDLVFPDAFRDTGWDERGPTSAEAGFDVVIGNPPAQTDAVLPLHGGEGGFLEVARRLTRKPHGRIAFVMMPPTDPTGA